MASFLVACTQEQQNLDSLNDHWYLTHKGANLPVQVEGNLSSGVAVVVLHGGPGGDATTYNELTRTFSDSLEKEFAMVYYDQRGAGVASGKYSSLEFNVNQHVDDLRVLLNAIMLRYGKPLKFFLMGHSWGGTLGTAFLVQEENQKMVSGWIEVDGAHNFSATQEIGEHFMTIGGEMVAQGHSVDFWTEAMEFVEEMDTASDVDVSTLNQYGYDTEGYLAKDGFLAGEDLSANLLHMQYFTKYNGVSASMSLFTSSSGLGMFDELRFTDFTDQLHKITVPCLFLWGKYDFVVPPALGYEAFRKVGTPNKEKAMYLFEASGHSPMINQPEIFGKTMKEWIKERL
jgi:pimeloyl-ACP methyl ester carboxylesterase